MLCQQMSIMKLHALTDSEYRLFPPHLIIQAFEFCTIEMLYIHAYIGNFSLFITVRKLNLKVKNKG
jgi:hypothetical protein